MQQHEQLTRAGQGLVMSQPAPLVPYLRAIVAAVGACAADIERAARARRDAGADPHTAPHKRGAFEAAALRAQQSAARKLLAAMRGQYVTLQAMASAPELQDAGADLSQIRTWCDQVQAYGDELHLAATREWITARLPYTATDYLPGADLSVCQ